MPEVVKCPISWTPVIRRRMAAYLGLAFPKEAQPVPQRPRSKTGGRDIRVFVSYASDNEEEVNRIEEALKCNGITVLRDKRIPGGAAFPSEIKSFIDHAQVFMPIISKKSIKKGWVQQEVGFAVGREIPMLPVRIGEEPNGFIRDFQAVDYEEGIDLAKVLRKEVFVDLLDRQRDTSAPTYECGRDNRERAEMMARYATAVRRLGYTGYVRQRGGLSSFHLPDTYPGHPEWTNRYGGVPREEHYCRALRRERAALEYHARHAGCRLIIKPYLDYAAYGPLARRARLQVLQAFLNDMLRKGIPCEVAVWEGGGPHDRSLEESLTLVGDWFAANAVSATLGKGYRQTIFTRHAPTISDHINEFDRQFEYALTHGRHSWKKRTSAEDAAALLEEEIRKTGVLTVVRSSRPHVSYVQKHRKP